MYVIMYVLDTRKSNSQPPTPVISNNTLEQIPTVIDKSDYVSETLKNIRKLQSPEIPFGRQL